MKNKSLIKLLAIIVVLAIGVLCSFAATITNRCSVTLAWDPSPGTNIASYRVYYGAASGVYTNHVSVGGSVTNATVTNLWTTVRYFFAATAFNTDGLESDFSNEVSWRADYRPLPPTLGSLWAQIQYSTNMINWTTATNIPVMYVGSTNGINFYRSVLSIER